MSLKQKIKQLAHDYKLARFILEGGDLRALSNFINKEELVPVEDVVAALSETIFPTEFEQFVKAMADEMRRHTKKKGESWKDETIIIGMMYPTHADYNLSQRIPLRMQADKYLEGLLRQCIQNFSKKHDTNELIDIANICGILWCRKEVLSKSRMDALDPPSHSS